MEVGPLHVRWHVLLLGTATCCVGLKQLCNKLACTCSISTATDIVFPQNTFLAALCFPLTQTCVSFSSSGSPASVLLAPLNQVQIRCYPKAAAAFAPRCLPACRTACPSLSWLPVQQSAKERKQRARGQGPVAWAGSPSRLPVASRCRNGSSWGRSEV